MMRSGIAERISACAMVVARTSLEWLSSLVTTTSPGRKICVFTSGSAPSDVK